MGVAARRIWTGCDCAGRIPAVPTTSESGRDPSRLHERGLSIGQRTVLNLLARYEELVTIHMTDRERLQSLAQEQGHLILAADGLRPNGGHEVLWVVRECASGEILLAWSLLSEREADLVTLLKEVQDAFAVPIHGVMRGWPAFYSQRSSYCISSDSSSIMSFSLSPRSGEAGLRSGSSCEERIEKARTRYSSD